MKNRIIKTTFLCCLMICVALGSGFLGYKFANHTAILQIHSVTPMQLAKAMQSDEFYSDFPQTMLLVKGTIASVSNTSSQTIVDFQTTSSPSVLPHVSCQMQEKSEKLTTGETISVLTVAYKAERVNTADVLLHNCYLVK